MSDATLPPKSTPSEQAKPQATTATHAAAPSPAAKPPAKKSTAKVKAATKAVATKKPKPAAPSKLAAPKPVKKLASKPAAKTAPKPAAKAAAKPAVTAAEKLEKAKKPKLVRDSFTIPKGEYTVLNELKLRTVKLGKPAKKSELLRAGIKVLAALDDAGFKAALQQVPTIKTGRPKVQAG